jgi:3-oxoacyl-[acyl-carrier protein] reductase
LGAAAQHDGRRGDGQFPPKEAGIARYGEPEEIAELMAFLVSPGARWMTGSTLRMDGGEVKSI